MTPFWNIRGKKRYFDFVKWISIFAVITTLLVSQRNHYENIIQTRNKNLEVIREASEKVAKYLRATPISQDYENEAIGKESAIDKHYENKATVELQEEVLTSQEELLANENDYYEDEKNPPSESLTSTKKDFKQNNKETDQIQEETSEIDWLQSSDFAYNVKLKANRDNVIFLSVFDESYFDLAVNLLSTSYAPLDITNFIFICETIAARTQMLDFGVPCILHEVVRDLHKASKFGTRAFIEKTLIKPLYVLKALQLGYKVVLVDVDIVFFKNPLKYIDCNKSSYDLCIQSDSSHDHSINSGFYFAHPTNATIKIHQDMVDTLTGNLNTRVQELMRELIISMTKDNAIRVKQLDTRAYPPGKVYFEYGRRMFKDDNVCSACVITHNNWILHKTAKVYRMKETGLWKVDFGGYYSNAAQNYLTYTNTLDVGNITVSLERNALKVALTIGKLLNRTVILPRFSCQGCTYSNCMRTTHRRCSMNTQFYMADFDQYFSNKYRENSFLVHELVPNSVKSCVSPVLYINSSIILSDIAKRFDFNLTTDSLIEKKSIDKVFTPNNLRVGVSSEEIVNWFKSPEYDKYKVLQFHSLYFGLTILSESHKDAKFSEALHRGLTGGDYRQNKIKNKFMDMEQDL